MHNVDTEIAVGRSLLFSVRVQFSPEIQPIKETAIDKIVEQNIFLSERAVTIDEIQTHGSQSFGDVILLKRHDVINSLKRLIKNDRVIEKVQVGIKKYELSNETLAEIQGIQEIALKIINNTLSRLFKDSEDGFENYRTPFLECLCITFSKLGEAYVNLLLFDEKKDDFLKMPPLINALDQVIRKYSTEIKDVELFEKALKSFFEEEHPDYSHIKWNMAQNFYITKALGLEQSGYLLSQEVFAGHIFYLDTNVIIPALESGDQHHYSFKTLINAFKRLSIQLRVCEVSLKELKGANDYMRQIIPKVANQVPEDTSLYAGGPFLRKYKEEQKKGLEPNLDRVFSSLKNPMRKLRLEYGVKRIDNEWFSIESDSTEIKNLTKVVQDVYHEKTGDFKNVKVARHDALMLKWIQKERDRGTKNLWLLTRDTSLPFVRLESERGITNAPVVSLDALLQWISPLVIQSNSPSDAADIFIEAILDRVLPQDNFFSLEDFLIFREMDIDTRELPTEDVEQCLRYIKKHAPGLNPSTLEDREKIAYHLAKFFASPQRKYKAELMEKDIRVRELEQEVLQHSAQIRLLIVVMITVVVEGVLLILASDYGGGENYLQRVLSFWPYLTGTPVVTMILGWFMLGKERIKALGWPFNKIFKE